MECDVIRDLIPLYKEDLLSDASTKLVDEHLKTCVTCAKYFEEITNDFSENKNEDQPLNLLNQNMIIQKLVISINL